MIRTGLLGHPVAHSRSPALHAAWFARTGVDGHYGVHDLDPATPGADVLAALDDLGWSGANLTVPFKTRVLPFLSGITRRARVLGAVNTLVRDEQGWRGRNTDVDGFVAELRALRIVPGAAVVLGAGGAARAVVAALIDEGRHHVTILNRSPERVRSLITDLRPLLPGGVGLTGGPLHCFDEVAAEAALIVNTTTGPARPTIATLDVGPLPAHCAWVDLNYWMADPPHLRALQRRGHPVGTGHRMLVHQGAMAFQAFTGVAPDPAVGLDILRDGSLPP